MSKRGAAENRNRKGAARTCRLALVAVALATLVLGAGSRAPEAAAASCANANTVPGKLGLAEARKAITCLINQRRADASRRALHRDRSLQKAAQRHTRRMDRTDCFAHACPGEPDLGARLKRSGYLHGGVEHSIYAENVAWGTRRSGTPAAIVKAWMHSSGHRANILHGSFRHLGVGFSRGTPHSKRASGGIYTVDFGDVDG